MILKAVVARDNDGNAQKQIEVRTTSPPGVAALGDARQARTTLAARHMLEDCVRRQLRRESDRARRAAASVATLESWAKVFYAAPECAALAGHLEPALAALAGVSDPAGRATVIALEWHAKSLRELVALARTGPADLKTSVTTLTESWIQSRPGSIADAVLAGIAP